ncbi:hypothetical protein TH728_02880 [Corynebacterium amycolatum]|uniref:hypothetical protein n=1 Tax=Corynebacterium amycolatum TaxID=43765 RepID=UPI002AAD08ED|nr:hypothetical protein [Corynebacterium amycolatum]MDY7341371.1 hypothetical protein [Corynebacterium amycolatum]
MTLRRDLIARWLKVSPILEEEAPSGRRGSIVAPKTRQHQFFGLFPSPAEHPNLTVINDSIGELLRAPRPCCDP